MIFRQIVNDDLACASYLVGDAGAAIVVDPAWEIDPYLDLARLHGLQIRHVLDTHVHADHVSGRERLAVVTGAESHLPTRALALHATIELGALRVDVVPTAGHRPEHVSLLITDTARSLEPSLLLSGDSLLVGDVARPDLAADDPAEVEEAARALFRSLRRLALLDDHVEIWPGHIAGSLCGAAGVTGSISSTIGFERRANVAFSCVDEDAFVGELGARLFDRPPTVDLVVALNRGSGVSAKEESLPALTPRRAASLIEAGAVVVDGREADVFDVASIPGSLSLPLPGAGIGTRAAWCLDATDAIVVVGDREEDGPELASRLAAVGLRGVKGALAGGVVAWAGAGLPVRATARLEVDEVARLLTDETITLVDVREQDEFEAFHIPGSVHLPVRDLGSRAGEVLASGKPIVVACASGRRTPLAASLLSRLGARDVHRLASGGIADLAALGVPVADGAAVAAR